MKRLDLSGKKIGKLTIIDYSHSHIQPSGQKRAMWNVICECGIKKKMSVANLTSGKIISCGCQGKKNRIESRRLGFGIANTNYLYLSYKHRSLKRHNKFELTIEQFKELIFQNCYYCGSEPEMRYIRRSTYGVLLFNGVDRLNSKEHYKIDNVVPCCKKCNFMKNSLGYDEFINHINKIYNYVTSKKRVQSSNYI